MGKRLQSDANKTKRRELLENTRDCKSTNIMKTWDDFKVFEDSVHKDWIIREEDDGKLHLIREFNVETYGEVMDICSTTMKCADEFNYHPNISVSHKQVIVDIFSYKHDGLRLIDFMFAAKIDEAIDILSKQYMD